MKSSLVTLGLFLSIATQCARAQESPTLLIGGMSDRGVQLANPTALVATRDRLIILDAAPPFLKVLSSDGKLVQTFGAAGAGPREFSGRALGLTTDEDGRV